MENGEMFLECIYLYTVHWFLYIIFSDNYYFNFSEKEVWRGTSFILQATAFDPVKKSVTWGKKIKM